MNWKYPRELDYWGNDNNYIMFIDENNSVSAVNTVKNKLINNEEISPNENFFTLTGCIFERKDYEKAKKELNLLRKKYWNNGKYDISGKIENVCFHTEDIKGRKKAFHMSIMSDLTYNNFILDLDKTIKKLTYTIISITIDLSLYIMINKINDFNVYNVACNFIIEKFIYFMGKNKKGSLIFEARGKKEDYELLNYLRKIVNNDEIKNKINGVFFNHKKNKSGIPYVGLEIADLSSYPIHRYIKFGTKGKDFITIEKKLNNYPDYDEKGIKIFPKK